MNVEAVLDLLGVAPRERKGRRVWAERCPLPSHAQHNPRHRYANFFVRPDSGLWYCYSEGCGGRLLELVAILRGCTDEEAISWLRDLPQEPEPPPYGAVRVVVRSPRAHAFRLPAGCELPGLPPAQWNGVPLAYARSRGVTDEQIARWRVTYALDGRLAGRVVLPAFDAQGRLGNYSARSFTGDAKRYLSAGDDERPDKGAIFGEHLWAGAAPRAAVVFEGAISGLAIERACSIALPETRVSLAGLSGSHLSARQVAKLARFTVLVAATDPDAAGDRAARALAGALCRRSEVRRLGYPGSADAADEDPHKLARALDRALRGI